MQGEGNWRLVVGTPLGKIPNRGQDVSDKDIQIVKITCFLHILHTLGPQCLLTK